MRVELSILFMRFQQTLKYETSFCSNTFNSLYEIHDVIGFEPGAILETFNSLYEIQHHF